jgi:2-dehydropantoate 2-reductase
LNKDGFVISLQNGFCEDELGRVVGEKRIIGCVTGWGATMESHGNFVMTSKGDFILGYPGKYSDELLSDLSEILSCIVPVRTTDNIRGHLYSKLIINSCVTSLGALCGLYLGKMLMIGKVRRIFIEIIKEAVEVADSMKVSIEIFAGKLDFKKFVEGKSIYSDFRRHIFLLAMGYKFRKLKSSSLQSLERGKLTEIEYLNGYIVRNAREYAVSAPINNAIVNMIHQIEQQKRKISVSNFNDPFFDRFR